MLSVPEAQWLILEEISVLGSEKVDLLSALGRVLAFVIFGIGWLIPFSYLLKRLTGRPPARHGPLVFVACLALIAIFLERMMLVFPSVTTEPVFPFGLSEALITAGFFSLFLLGRIWFLARYRPRL